MGHPVLSERKGVNAPITSGVHSKMDFTARMSAWNTRGSGRRITTAKHPATPKSDVKAKSGKRNLPPFYYPKNEFAILTIGDHELYK
jgi:hypothetical protein